MTGNSANQGGSPGANTLNYPLGISSDSQRLIVADTVNHRILTYKQRLYLNSSSVNHGLAGKEMVLKITGTYASSTPTVKLVGGTVEINATNISLQSSTRIACKFKPDVFPGVYNLQVLQEDDVSTLPSSFFILDKLTSPIRWQKTSLGQMDSSARSGVSALAVADGNNDGQQEIYATCGATKIFQYKQASGQWGLSSLPEQSSGMTALVIADLDLDSKYEVYGAFGQNVKQFTSAEWAQIDLGAVGYISSLAYGDGNNDGESELYAACADRKLYQFKLTQGKWTVVAMASLPSALVAVAVSDGNGDNENEVYTSDQDKKVYQCKYNNVAWDIMEFPAIAAAKVNSLAVGDGDGNGENEIYGASEDGKIYRYQRIGGIWEASIVGQGINAWNSVVVNDADSDGADEVYAASADGHIYVFRASNGQWQKEDLGDADSPLRALAIGDGDNDNRFEIYALDADNQIWQFKAETASLTPTPTPTLAPTPLPVPDHQIYAYPSRFNPEKGEYSIIQWFQSESEPATIKIYNLRGELIKTLVDHAAYAKGQEHKVQWRGNNNSGSTVASGIYVVHIQTGNYRDRIKLCVLK